MIISASYRTDIPAFYGEWFMNRLRDGFCMIAHPYNKQVYRASLLKEDVDGFVFWTKNLGPFVHHLETIRETGYPFIIQYTINGYPRTLEFSVVDAERSVKHMHQIADRYGPRVAVWRYDTIVFTSVTDVDFHRRNFEKLARELEGATDEVVISFAQIYKKTLRNMNWAAKEFDFTWEDPSDKTKLQLASDLVQIANAHHMQLTVCTQPDYVIPGSKESRCIDAGRLSDVAGKPVRAKLKGSRPDCGCFMSRDIGAYDTCPHGCAYCYAVQNRDLAQKRYKQHDPNSAFLFSSPELERLAIEINSQPRLL